MREFTVTKNTLSVIDGDYCKTIDRSFKSLNLEAQLTNKVHTQRAHEYNKYLSQDHIIEHEKDIDFIDEHVKIDSSIREYMTFTAKITDYELIRIHFVNDRLIENKIGNEIKITINNIHTISDSHREKPIPSTIGIDNGSKFNGMEFIHSDDDVPSLYLSINVTKEQYEYIENLATEESFIGIYINVFCHYEIGHWPSSETFKHDIFFLDTREHGFHEVCIVESITIASNNGMRDDELTLATNEDDFEATNEFDNLDNAINQNINSIKHSLYQLEKISKNIESMPFWQIIQTTLLGVIAWKFF